MKGPKKDDPNEAAGLALRQAQGIIFSELGREFVECDRMDVSGHSLRDAIRRVNKRLDNEARRYFEKADAAAKGPKGKRP